MTEHEWLACQKPDEILEWIQRWPVVVSDRKLRLFACALVRQVWRLLTDTRSRTAVEVAEQFADGHTSSANLAAARAAAWDAAWDAARAAAQAAAQAAARDAAEDGAEDAAWAAARVAARDAVRDAARDAARVAAWDAQANLLRDIVGNPWRPVVLPLCDRCDGDYRMRWIDDPDTGQCPGCIRGKKHLTPTALSLAQGAYDARSSEGTLDPVRLMILADALEEAGCTTEELLAHLRSPGPHVRGCWALDLILGKE